jgi:hypothetical protein
MIAHFFYLPALQMRTHGPGSCSGLPEEQARRPSYMTVLMTQEQTVCRAKWVYYKLTGLNIQGARFSGRMKGDANAALSNFRKQFAR